MHIAYDKILLAVSVCGYKTSHKLNIRFIVCAYFTEFLLSVP